ARASAPAAEPVAGAAAKSTRAVVERLPIAKLVGQRVIVSYEGAEPPQQLFDLIRKGYVAGVIFFGANTNEDPALTRQVAMRMQRARLAAKPKALRRPLLLMTDQEGGLVRRLPGEPELSEWQISARRNAAGAAGKAGAGAARTLAAAGINVNLAPVLGVQRPGSSFLGQFQRAYARWRNPRKVGKLAKAFVTQLQRRGVAATSKHFPGLGAATEKQDTDAAPVTLRLSQRTIDRIDLVPYPWVIAARTKLVMVNNAVYPSLDPTRPASLSRPIIEGILRRRLGYRGVTITDALEAGALAPFGGIPHRGVLAAEAGDDLLLFSQQKLIEGINGSEALRTALRSGRLDRDRFERAALRVLKLRGQLQVKPSRPLP
ncbi:MAG: beta-N-acetylhexosaminidase, partial [Actinobacteria bacterium]|nr:beta-N-acetylhexosaminidase [Actinomycetota bacterium]